jgi:hypothetical protein
MLSIQSFDPPIYRTWPLSDASAYYDHETENALKIWWSAWPDNEPSSLVVPSKSLRLHCHKRRSLDHGCRLEPFHLLHHCLYTVRGVSALFVSPSPVERSLFSHQFGHALDRRVALIFWLFMPPSRLISERNTFSFVEDRLLSMALLAHDNARLLQPDATTAHAFLNVSVAGIVGAVSPHHESFVFPQKISAAYNAGRVLFIHQVNPSNFLQHF